MIELLGDLTEIHFEVFWDKFQEKAPGDWYPFNSGVVWFSMKEEERIAAFKHLCLSGPIGTPHYHLKSFKK